MRKFFSFTFICAFSVNVCFSATIDTATFTASADSTIAGSFGFELPSNGVADLSNVTAFNATSTAIDYVLLGPYPDTVVVPAATYTLADLSNFSYGPFPGCGEGGNPLFANVICELLEASFSGPQQQFTSLIVDIDPAGRIVEGLASYAPIPNQPGFHGFVTSFTVTGTTVPEPSTSFYVAMVAVCLLLLGTLRAVHHAVIPPRR